MGTPRSTPSRSRARPCSTRSPKRGRPRPSGPSAGTQGWRVDAVNLTRRRAHRYVPVAAALCRELLLDGSRAHAGGLCRARMGRRADNGPGPENRPELRGLHGPHLRSGEYQGAGVQPGALGAQLSRKHSDERLEAARTAQRRYLAPGTSRRSSRPCRRPCRR